MLDGNYEFKTAEPRMLLFWETEGVYKFDPTSQKKIFSIDTPPPTVSGKMHIGHSFSYSQQDFVARYKRMRGFNVFYPFGTDDNGLATERLIEKMKNVKGAHMDREEFIKLCETTLEEIRPDFVNDWKMLGISCDYSIFYSTINAHSRRVSQESFIELYEKGLEYQKEAPSIWCPTCHTAIAQVELKDKEHESSFNDIVFKVNDKDLIIATTRPEMLGSCVAVFAHPNDDRYKKLFGKKAKVPLFNHEVPILPDERADPAKGTGIVMCCTFGDQTDIEWYKAHNLPLVVSIDKSGIMTEKAGKYKGLKIKEARKLVIEDLKAAGLLIKEEKIKHVVNTHERCGTEIEILNTKQWFIKYLDLKEKFLEQGSKLHWHPTYMKNRFDNWVNGLQWDWCISRQRFFGVPFPVWYCKKCSSVMLAEKKDLPVDPLKDKPKKKCKCGSSEYIPEKDVMDTWATSSLTPKLAASLFPEILDKLYPMSLRPQAHDIISFWLFNTLVKSYLHHKKNPWKDVMISGWVLDPNREKMSKSKGNVISPQEVIGKYGADALRFWAAGSKLGEDLPYMEKDLVTGQKMVTKLWNASKFVLMQMQDYKPEKNVKLEAFDAWLLSKLSKIIETSTEHFDKYEYNRTKLEVEKFFWQTFCDNYLEIVKDRIYNEKRRGKDSAQYTLYHALLAVLKLLAPIMPYITEEIYQKFYKDKEKAVSIHISEWPKPFNTDEDIEKQGDMAIEVISAVRKMKTSKNVSLKTPVKKVVVPFEPGFFLEDLKAVCNAEHLTSGKELEIVM